jgi:hypothetical protein
MASGGFTVTLAENCTYRAEFVLGLLNSRLLFWVLENSSNVFRGGWITCTKQYFGELPIKELDLTAKSDRSRHDALVAHVERMMKLHADLAAAKSPDAQTHLQREIAATDRAIDQLVYQLYGLTRDEIALVEKATAAAVQSPEPKETEPRCSP